MVFCPFVYVPPQEEDTSWREPEYKPPKKKKKKKQLLSEREVALLLKRHVETSETTDILKKLEFTDIEKTVYIDG